MTACRRTFLEANGIRLHVTQQGTGPLVLLCQGFPATAHAWRHQLAALAHTGYHTVAPDLRGYGLSDCPLAVEQYTVFDSLGDLIGLVDALGARDALVTGNDSDATLAWQTALLRPDRFRAVAALGVPLMGRAPMVPSPMFPHTDRTWFYTHYFVEPGLAESELGRDIGLALRQIYLSASGDIGAHGADTPSPFGLLPRRSGLLDSLRDPPVLPAWLPPSDLEAFVQSYRASGFRGGWNDYRNRDRNWARQAGFDGLTVRPSGPLSYR